MGSSSSKEKKKEKRNGNNVTYEIRVEETKTTYNFLGFKSSEEKKTTIKTESAPVSLFSPLRSITGKPPANALEY